MPWYKSGTVSVTLNSSAVIGTGTAFIANSRVGDAFRGPDGGWYEVINIASDTAMSISPNYKGATTAAGAYALAPMQGYVKDSADALRGIVNAYGAKLAALGITGNYDILPVTKGGTGGATQSEAQAQLGLPRTTSIADGTAGRLIGIGDLGLGVALASTAYELANLNATNTTPGEWRIGSSTAGTKPFNFGLVKIWQQATTAILQMAQEFGTGVRADRAFISGAWTAWVFTVTVPTYGASLPVTKGGTGGTGQASARSGLGLGSVAIENVLPIAKGGTGATTAAGAISALGGIAVGRATGTAGTRVDSGAPPNIAGITPSGNNNNTALTIGNSNNPGASAVMSFIRDGAFACHLGIDTDNVFKVGGWSYGNVAYKIYHEGNTTRAADGTLKAI
jgi:hypothetical protein